MLLCYPGSGVPTQVGSPSLGSILSQSTMKSFPLEALASLGVPQGAGIGFQLLCPASSYPLAAWGKLILFFVASFTIHLI